MRDITLHDLVKRRLLRRFVAIPNETKRSKMCFNSIEITPSMVSFKKCERNPEKTRKNPQKNSKLAFKRPKHTPKKKTFLGKTNPKKPPKN